MSRGERKAMIAPGHRGLSVSRQCRLLSISRSSFYYAPRAESPENLALMRRIDELYRTLHARSRFQAGWLAAMRAR